MEVIPREQVTAKCESLGISERRLHRLRTAGIILTLKPVGLGRGKGVRTDYEQTTMQRLEIVSAFGPVFPKDGELLCYVWSLGYDVPETKLKKALETHAIAYFEELLRGGAKPWSRKAERSGAIPLFELADQLTKGKTGLVYPFNFSMPEDEQAPEHTRSQDAANHLGKVIEPLLKVPGEGPQLSSMFLSEGEDGKWFQPHKWRRSLRAASMEQLNLCRSNHNPLLHIVLHGLATSVARQAGCKSNGSRDRAMARAFYFLMYILPLLFMSDSPSN